jgi:hypothetical protein
MVTSSWPWSPHFPSPAQLQAIETWEVPADMCAWFVCVTVYCVRTFLRVATKGFEFLFLQKFDVFVCSPSTDVDMGVVSLWLCICHMISSWTRHPNSKQLIFCFLSLTNFFWLYRFIQLYYKKPAWISIFLPFASDTVTSPMKIILVISLRIIYCS